MESWASTTMSICSRSMAWRMAWAMTSLCPAISPAPSSSNASSTVAPVNETSLPSRSAVSRSSACVLATVGPWVATTKVLPPCLMARSIMASSICMTGTPREAMARRTVSAARFMVEQVMRMASTS